MPAPMTTTLALLGNSLTGIPLFVKCAALHGFEIFLIDN
jgi:hypothetical protein